MDSSQEGEKRLHLVCFFIAGTSFGISYPLALTAAEDILSGLVVPTSVVLVSISVPGFLMALTSPLFFDRIGRMFSDIYECNESLVSLGEGIMHGPTKTDQTFGRVESKWIQMGNEM